MTVLQAVVLGLIQGLTEFLPISSSGHLVLAEHLLGVPMTDDITFEVFVHFGTLLSVLVVFRRDVVATVRSVAMAFVPKNMRREYFKGNTFFWLAVYLLVGSIPAAVIGIRFESEISAAFADPKLVAVMLVVTGLILFLTGLAKPVEGRNVSAVSAFVIGLAQALAIIPGISRSGSTISTAMYLGIPPLAAARFSFLLSLPVIAGATLLKTKDLVLNGAEVGQIVTLAAGTVTAFLSGYAAIRFLLTVLERGKIRWFALYCLLAGIAGIVLI